MGLEPLQPPEAIAMVGLLLGTAISQAAAARVDWSVFLPVYSAKARRPFLEAIEAERAERR